VSDIRITAGPYAFAAPFRAQGGRLAGNPFLTIVEGAENLRPLGELPLWHGAQPVEFASI